MLAALVLAAGAVMTGAPAPAPTPATDPLRAIAERYVRLVLAVGQHDGDYVDAYYGPPEWRKEAEASKVPLPVLDGQAAAIEADLAAAPAAVPVPKDAELWALRRQYLVKQLSAVRARVAMLQGKPLTFDEESRALYDAVAPTSSRRC
jgi:hypothetical protein